MTDISFTKETKEKRNYKKIAILLSVVLIAVGLLLCFVVFAINGFHLSVIDTESSERKTVTISDNFKNIDINTLSDDIRIEKSTDKKCQVVYNDTENIDHTIKVQDNTLHISVNDERKWYQHIHIGFYFSETPKITLYLPEKNYRNLTLHSTSGEIEIVSKFTFQNTELESTSGDITIQDSAFAKTNLNTTSGEITVSHSQFDSIAVATLSGEIEIADTAVTADSIFESTSGDTQLTTVQSRSMQIATTSGDINLSEIVSHKDTQIETTSGEVTFKNADVKETTVNTTSGDVSGTIKGNKNFITNTTSGDVKVPNSYSDKEIFSVFTTSGDINIRIADK